MSNFFWHIASGIIDATDTNIPTAIGTGNADNAVKTILTITFSIIGAIAFLMVTIAGFMMVISSGEPQKVAKARQTIVYSVVGLIICLLAVAIVQFVVGKV